MRVAKAVVNLRRLVCAFVVQQCDGYKSHVFLKCLGIFITTQGRWQSKTLILSTNVDQKLLEAEFFFYCRLLPDWRQMAI